MTGTGILEGLSSREAVARLAADGPNTVPAPPPPGWAGRVFQQLSDPLVALLLAAFAVTVLIGDFTDAAVIALVVIVNTTIGVAQETRADHAIAALDQLSAPTARVVRDGRDRVVVAADLVRGDLVRVEAGDVAPADLRLSAAHRLLVDESRLTGESVPVRRDIGDELRAGSVMVAGRAAGVVARTGADSGLGRIAALVATTRPGPTPLQRRLAGLGRMLGLVAVLLCAVVFLAGLAAGRPPLEMAITAVSLVVAAVPESLPAVVTVALALAARRMAAQHGVPRRLHSVETLGSVTVVASDKTGTLTEGRMAVQRVIDAQGREYVVSGRGYEPDGQVRPAGSGDPAAAPPPPGAVPDAVVELARAGLLCNDAAVASPNSRNREWHPVGDPLEAALVVLAVRCGLSAEGERAAWPRVAEHPFDQDTRRMTTVHYGLNGVRLAICKGAPEAVLDASLVDAPPGTAAAAARLAAQGLRVLALAAGHPDSPDPRGADPASPGGLRYLGLVGIGDPIRAQSPEIAGHFAGAGIRLILITGDHPATASAIGGQLGLWEPGDPVHHGDEGGPDPERVDRVRVFARTQPEQKLDIVAALQARGHVVAMTGDGVNDAPALRQADIGVAMGGGTEVARQAADLVLVDDNLATVATAVREGRRIYDNVRRFLHYGLAGGSAEILVMLVGPLLGLAVPLLPAQILWINLLTHGVPGVALGAEPAEPATMARPPRSPQESVLGGGLLGAVLRTGFLLAVTVLVAGVAAERLGRPWQSVVFLVLGLAQLGVALAVRATRTPGGERSRALAGAVILSAALQLAGVLVPPLRTLLGTEALSGVDLAACLALAAIPGAVLAIVRVHRPAGTVGSALSDRRPRRPRSQVDQSGGLS